MSLPTIDRYAPVIQDRQNGKPNSATRNRMRHSLGTICWTCGLEGTWNADAPDDIRLELGHIVSRETGGTYHYTNVMGQCAPCNDAAEKAGIHDLTNDILFVPKKWMAQKLADSRGKANQECIIPGLPGIADREAAREARGLVW